MATIIVASVELNTTPGFFGQGIATAGRSALSVTFSCSNMGPFSSSLSYSVTSATTVDFTVPMNGYTAVATYSLQ